MEIPCEISATDLDGKDAIEATCTECGLVAACLGDDRQAVKEALKLLRAKCRKRGRRRYVPDDELDEDDEL